MKKCPNCETEWQDKDIFCGECGSFLIEEETKSISNSELQTDSLNKSSNEEKSISSSNSSSGDQKSIEGIVPINLDIKKVESELNEPDIKIQENLIVCKKCGKELPDGTAFCMYCGTFVRADSAPEVTILIECPSCHKEISRFAVSCPNCGHPFPENFLKMFLNLSPFIEDIFK